MTIKAQNTTTRNKGKIKDTSKHGRRYTQEQKLTAMRLICEAIACSNKGIQFICDNNESLPAADTVYSWLMQEAGESGESGKPLSVMYARAKEAQTEFLADELLSIADDTSRDTDIDGKANNASVQRDRLRVESRKWLLAKLNRRKYGDTIDVEHRGEVGISLEQRLIAARDRIEQGEKDITPATDYLEHDGE